jgi:WD40 repeat protein
MSTAPKPVRRAFLPALVCALAGTGAFAQSAPQQRVSFRRQVAPILVKRCLACHDDRKASGGLSMSTFAALRRGGKELGDAILEPGDPESSELIATIQPGAPVRMPYKQPPLGGDEIAVLTRWVKEGAAFDGPSATETPLASLADVLSGLPRVALKVPAADPVASIAFSPDGRLLAAGAGREAVVYDVATKKGMAALGDHPGPVNSVRFSPDGASLVVAGGRPGLFGSLTVWDVPGRKKRLDVRGHSDGILAAEIAPGGTTLATAGYDKQILIWDLATGKVVRPLKDHSDAVYGLSFSPDGKVLASCAADRTVKLWDWSAGRRMATLSESTAELYAVAFTPDGSRMLAAGVDRSIRMWRVRGAAGHVAEPRLERSAFAHDAAILRLAVSADGKLVASSAEDRTVRLWDLATLSPRAPLPAQADWVQALAFAPDDGRLALGRYDGSLALWDVTGRPASAALVLREPPARTPSASSSAPSLMRDATLNPPSPRGGLRGGKLKVTLTGIGVGRATAVLLPEPGVTATILPAKQPDANRLEVELAIAPDARVGPHAVGVATPLGVPGFQRFDVVADPEVAEREPNDQLPSGDRQGTFIPLPATLLGTIDRPGDVDRFRFEARAGQDLVFRVVAGSMRSMLRPVLTLSDAGGRVVAQAEAGRTGAGGGMEPVLAYTARADGPMTLEVADADLGGSGAHFYRISAGAIPFVRSVFPMGVERGTTARIEVDGCNLGGVRVVSLPVGPGTQPGSIIGVPVVPVGGRGRQPSTMRNVVVADGPQAVERETNDATSQAQELPVPGGVSGHIGHDGDVDCYRFRARKGDDVIVEVFGRRLGSPVDSIVEVLDGQGRPLPRAVLRPVDQTEVAFRDHPSTRPAIRLTHWDSLTVNDYLWFGRELTRIQALPRNPDDDCIFWSQSGQRLGWLETTPEQHPMGQVMYKVEIHPPGTEFPPGGVPATTLTYRNDDGGPSFSKDSRVTFHAPADGDYLARVEDVRGSGGEDYGYHLVLRRPRPSFQVILGTENPNIPRGGTTLVDLTLMRRDGFDAPVEVVAEGLPPGVTASPALIAGDELGGMLALSADASAPAFSLPSWRVVAREVVAREAPGYTPRRQEIDPGGPTGGRITVTPVTNVKVEARPRRVVIRPGERVSMTLAVQRGPAFKGRVPIDVRNLPQGVRVLNIGLNGVLITEAQTERTVFLMAEPWARPMVRPFYAVAQAESAGTNDSSAPIELVVAPETTADSGQ